MSGRGGAKVFSGVVKRPTQASYHLCDTSNSSEAILLAPAFEVLELEVFTATTAECHEDVEGNQNAGVSRSLDGAGGRKSGKSSVFVLMTQVSEVFSEAKLRK